MKRFLLVTIIFLFSIMAGSTLLSCSNTDYDPPLDQGRSDLQSFFALRADYLYVLDAYKLRIYKLNDNGTISNAKFVEVGQQANDIFIKDSNLFIGTSSSGMDVYDITQPKNPAYTSSISNVVACDHVDFSDHYLFRSTQALGACNPGPADGIQVIDISTPIAFLYRSVATDTPAGLSIDGNILFACGGESGLKIFNISDVNDITLVKAYPDIKGITAIAEEGILLLTSPEGIDQYDYSDLQDVNFLSHIPVQQ